MHHDLYLRGSISEIPTKLDICNTSVKNIIYGHENIPVNLIYAVIIIALNQLRDIVFFLINKNNKAKDNFIHRLRFLIS